MSTAKKILICDDDDTLRESLCEQFALHEEFSVFEAPNAAEAMKLSKSEHCDLVLLDIQLAGKKDGIELAERIQEDYDLPFIFLTSHSDQATIERAKAVNPPGYLVKPFSPEELYASIEVALHNYSRTHPHRKDVESGDEQTPAMVLKDALFIKQGQSYTKLRFDDIHYVKSDHVYVELHTPNKQFVVRNSLSNYMDLLPDYFYRVHRSYLINLHHLEGIEAQDVVVMGRHLPIAKVYRNDLLEQIQKDS